jgi:hypothetical protein
MEAECTQFLRNMAGKYDINSSHSKSTCSFAVWENDALIFGWDQKEYS